MHADAPCRPVCWQAAQRFVILLVLQHGDSIKRSAFQAPLYTCSVPYCTSGNLPRASILHKVHFE